LAMWILMSRFPTIPNLPKTTNRAAGKWELKKARIRDKEMLQINLRTLRRGRVKSEEIVSAGIGQDSTGAHQKTRIVRRNDIHNGYFK